jgi:hypothetical protein
MRQPPDPGLGIHHGDPDAGPEEGLQEERLPAADEIAPGADVMMRHGRMFGHALRIINRLKNAIGLTITGVLEIQLISSAL